MAIKERIVAQATKMKVEVAGPAAEAQAEEEIAYLSKRHRVSPAIVRDVIRRIGASERSAIEREIRKGMARR